MSLIYWPAKSVARFSPWLGNKLIQKGGMRPLVAHHGLQRSGTNYLNQCLIRFKVYPLNVFDEKRSSPRHKHCRWYADKASIPSFLVDQYGNSHIANDLSRLNMVCRYPRPTKHLVVYKEKKDWLVSVLNWGWKCGWFSNESHARASLNELSRDYDCYLSFWRNLATRHPDSVAVTLLNDILGKPACLQSLLHSVGVEAEAEGFNGEFDVVPQSPRNRYFKFDHLDIPECFFSD